MNVLLKTTIRSFHVNELDPVPKLLFLRDVLSLPPDSPEIIKAKADVMQSKWVRPILALQHADGGFGYFHSLANPTKQQPMTTEQALHRLLALGLDISDEPIRKTAVYMERALAGEIETPDRVEKLHTWSIYMPLMLAAWLHRLCPGSQAVLAVARRWARILESAFEGYGYDHGRYLEAYEDEFACRPNPKAGRLVDFVHFYPLTLLQGLLSPETERRMLAHVINHEPGIYYVLRHAPARLPQVFGSAETGRYLSALELLAGYAGAAEKLAFAGDWLVRNRDGDGFWDMGPEARDGVHFPLSESWRRPMNRKIDCTVRILSLLQSIDPEA
jgi:hypothetical protein